MTTGSTRQPGTTSRAYKRLAVLCVAAAAALSLVSFSWSPRARADAVTGAFQLIIHPDNPFATVDRDFLARLFLKKTTRWPNGAPAQPADLAPDSPVRDEFSARVLQRSVPAVRSFWQQRIFSGRDVPPPELGSEQDVVRFVLSSRGAVGYVSTHATLGRAKLLVVR